MTMSLIFLHFAYFLQLLIYSLHYDLLNYMVDNPVLLANFGIFGVSLPRRYVEYIVHTIMI